MALVVPRRGKAQETAQLLLELADSVWHVRTTTEFGGDGGIAFLIPDELHDKYLEAIGQAPVGEEEEAPAPAPKRRGGRPRKAVPAVEPDATESETEEE
jgi:hypothetical protein